MKKIDKVKNERSDSAVSIEILDHKPNIAKKQRRVMQFADKMCFFNHDLLVKTKEQI